jgi:4-hydroxy-3-methylbut-2-enyl diphosphate reductase IspH
VGVFRAIARSTAERDYVLEMLLDHIGVDLDYEEAVGVTYDASTPRTIVDLPDRPSVEVM